MGKRAMRGFGEEIIVGNWDLREVLCESLYYSWYGRYDFQSGRLEHRYKDF